MAAWRVAHATGSAADLHARPVDAELARSVHVLDVDRPALVLGSAQRDDVIDAVACEAAGVEVVRRRSGGGAVLLEPGGVVWVDVELPRGDPLWDDDVGRAAWWVGERWAAALGDDLGELRVHRGGLERSRWSDLVCFAGLGPGEVTTADGRKVVGIAQRRTRAGARFQCAVPRQWNPAKIADLLALPPEERSTLTADLHDGVAPVTTEAQTVVDTFLHDLEAT